MKNPKVIIYDSDGMLTHGPRFSDKYSEEFKIDINLMIPFFKGPFKKCLIGEADLKEELEPWLKKWKWERNSEELLDYWFSVGDQLDLKVYDSIDKLKTQGLKTALATNQEKYRTNYLIKEFQYDKVFDEIFSSAFMGTPKTSLEGLEKIRSTFNAENEEIIFWDDDDDNITDLNKAGFNAQKYTDYSSFKQTMKSLSFEL